MIRHASQLLCFLAACGLAHGFQAQAPAKGSIEGQVVNGKTGTPLKRATVRLVATNSGGISAAPMAPIPPTPPIALPGGVNTPAALANLAQTMVNRMPTMMTRETDEQGRFVFTGLDAGKYRITAERQGYLRQSYGARRYSGGSTPVAVSEGGTVKAINFRLSPQGVITGKVLDEDGEPVANVQVRAQKSVNRGGKKQWNVVANANTTDIGEYRLPELQPGRYVVVTSPRNNNAMANTPSTEPLPATAEMTYAATFYPSTPDSSTAIPVDVGEGGEVRNIDIRLVKARVFRVRGKVVGAPAGGRGMVPVMLTARDGGPGQVQMAMGQARGGEGIFEIRNVPPGQYLAHAQTQGGGQQAVAVAEVDVIGSHVDGLVLTLSTGGDVQGSVKVVDVSTPVEMKNLQVSLRPVGFGAQAPRAKVGEDLKFTLKGVPPIRYAVNVSGYPDTCYVKSIQYGGADVTDNGVQMTNGGTVEVTISGAAGQIDAVVMTKDSKVAASAQVLILKDAVPWQSRSTDENGMLSLHGLKPGDYKVIAWEDVDPSQLWDTDFLRKFENEGKSVKIDAGGHEAVQLKAIPPDA
jgi:uncharacterized protein (DUF2141 family)